MTRLSTLVFLVSSVVYVAVMLSANCTPTMVPLNAGFTAPAIFELFAAVTVSARGVIARFAPTNVSV